MIKWTKETNLLIIFFCITFLLSGCTILKFTGQVIETTGKVAVGALKFTGKVVETTGKVLITVVTMPWGKKVIPLIKKGDSYLVDVLLNRKVKARLVLDTGAMHTLITQGIARKLGIDPSKGEQVLIRVAGGYTVSARAMNIKEVRIKGVRVRNVRAVVFDQDETQGYDGLLGMSFLNNFNFQVDTEKNRLILKKKK